PATVSDARCCDALKLTIAPLATLIASAAEPPLASEVKLNVPELTFNVSAPVPPLKTTGLLAEASKFRVSSPPRALIVIVFTKDAGYVRVVEPRVTETLELPMLKENVFALPSPVATRLPEPSSAANAVIPSVFLMTGSKDVESYCEPVK